MAKESAEILSEIRKNYILSTMKGGKRIDGRLPDEFRELTIIENYIPRANGSAYVALGNTRVVAGVKIESGEPFPDTPDQGVLTTNVELLPIAFPSFEAGPPNDLAIEVSRVVDRGIRESKMISPEKLVIEQGKKVWIVFLDINVLDYDGNLIDASTIAAVAALRNAVVPASKEGGENFKLPVSSIPISVTMVKIGETLVCDPSLEEDQICGGRITVTTTEDGHIRAMQKGEIGAFTVEDVKKAIKMSLEVGKKLREKYFR
ncbi:exosome complex protein Rrp42 [Thermoplasma sp.]|uniref:exosome complex protein Rrp42 n=1 Tax=Thermoplasma sp. TaxID=1973142 RepID=UPI001272E409|nr:exosome complex protein Rrp42 [Thermoplasma sp.]KAA8922058.1 MAG: exosome complex protein Rrp42 [Thermoplasma sp.]